MRRLALVIAMVAASSAGLAGPAAHGAAAGRTTSGRAQQPVRGDFNGDGVADLAMGAPGRSGNGEVDVLYGSGKNGLVLTGSDTFPGDVQSEFGYALAAGDFNADGFSDLAIAERAFPNQNYQGKVYVFYGTKHGLDLADDQALTQGDGLPGSPQNEAEVGAALATGDFNGDGVDDLVVGAPGGTVEGVQNAGQVFVLHGVQGPRTAGGLDTAHVRTFDESTFGMPGSLTPEYFGAPLVAADFGKSTADDLAVGKPDAKVGAADGAGQVLVLYGGTHGLSTKGAQLFSQATAGVPGKAQETATFGVAMAEGSFGRGSTGDLAIGANGYDVGSVQNAGAVVVLYGSAAGLSTAGAQLLTENTPGVPQSVRHDDSFGSSLADGNLGKGSLDDLAVGAPEKTIAGIVETGAVFVLYGGSSGLSGSGAQFLWEGSKGVGGDPKRMDLMGGGALHVANFGHGPTGDLAIGIPNKALGPASNAGIVDVLYGSASGVTAAGTQLFRHGNGSLPGTAHQGDEFGFALA